MITLSEITEAYRNASHEERQEFIELILPDLINNHVLEEKATIVIEKVLLTSELKPIKRIAELETITGLKDYSDFEEEHEPTIPEKISLLSEKINNLLESTREPIIQPGNFPTGKTEIRACALVDHLKKSGKDHLTTHEIIHFLKCRLPESCKIDENIQNIRKVKQDVLNKAASMYPNVFLSKKKTGHKEVRLVLSS